MKLENPFPKSSTYFETLKQIHLEEAAQCLNVQFVHEEPLMKSLCVNSDDFLEITRAICKQAIAEGISVAALDENTHTLKGVMICLDLESPFSCDVEKLCPKILPIFDLMDQMKNKYRKKFPSKPGKTVESFMTAVYRKHAHEGLTSGLINEALPLWISKGYQKVVGCLTHPVTQKIVLRLPGISIFDQIKLSEYEYKGTKPFAHVTEVTSCIFTQSESYTDVVGDIA